MKRLLFSALLILAAVFAFAQEGDPVSVTVDPEGGVDVRITVTIQSDQQQGQQQPGQQQYYAPAQQQQYYAPAQQQQQYAQQQQGQQVELSPEDREALAAATANAVSEAMAAREAEAEAAAPDQPWPRSQFFAIELGLGFPIHINSAYYSATASADTASGAAASKDKRPSFNIAPNVALLYNVGPMLAFTVEGDFYYTTSVYGTVNDKTTSASLFGTNVLFAPVFTFYNTPKARIAAAFGFHLYYSGETLTYVEFSTAPPAATPHPTETTDLQIGIGGYFGFQQHMSDNVYWFGRLNVTADLGRWVTTTDSEGVTSGSIQGFFANGGGIFGAINLGFKPVFGLGIKF